MRLKHARLDASARPGFVFQKLDIVERSPMAELSPRASSMRSHIWRRPGCATQSRIPPLLDANLVGFLHVLEGCRMRASGTWFRSSSSVYGRTPAAFSEPTTSIIGIPVRRHEEATS